MQFLSNSENIHYLGIDCRILPGYSDANFTVLLPTANPVRSPHLKHPIGVERNPLRTATTQPTTQYHPRGLPRATFGDSFLA
jgi:hypothetical protein